MIHAHNSKAIHLVSQHYTPHYYHNLTTQNSQCLPALYTSLLPHILHLTSHNSKSITLHFQINPLTQPLPRQNNALLSSLATKTSHLKNITLNIYDHARDQDVLDNTSSAFSSMGTNLKSSVGRLTRMAGQGDKIAVLKVAAIIIGAFLVVWFVGGWILRLLFGR